MFFLSHLKGKFPVFSTKNLLVLYFLSSLAQVNTSKPLHKILHGSQNKCIFDLLSSELAWFGIFHIKEFGFSLLSHCQGWNSFI